MRVTASDPTAMNLLKSRDRRSGCTVGGGKLEGSVSLWCSDESSSDGGKTFRRSGTTSYVALPSPTLLLNNG